MATAKIDDATLLARLTEVFQRFGYDGASLSRLSAATGLGRASLYHRFPGGKAEMAEAVLTGADAWFGENVLGPLRASGGDPRRRVREMARGLGSFYLDGQRSCLLDTLAVGQEDSRLRDHVRLSMGVLHDALSTAARDAGWSSRDAGRRAEDALVAIQGALVVARGRDDPRIFQRVLRELPDRLLGSDGAPQRGGSSG